MQCIQTNNELNRILIIIVLLLPIIIIIIIIFIETRLQYTIGKIIKYRWLRQQVGK